MARYRLILLLLSPLVLSALLYTVLHFTDPGTVGPWGILGVFILIYAVGLSILFIILRIGLSGAARVLKPRATYSTGSPVNLDERKAYYVASVIALIPVALLAMQAFSRIQLVDVVLVLFLVSVLVFYILKRQ